MSQHRFDHVAALQLYIALEPPNRTYARVAKDVGASQTSVRRWAREERWEEQLAAAQQRAIAKALKSREQISALNLRILGKGLDRIADRLDADDVTDDFVQRVTAQASKDYRLDIGEATDNVAVAEVQAGFRTYGATAHELLEQLIGEGLEGRGLVVAFRSRLPVLVQERLALIGGDDG